jgi:hypothetical protein
MAIMTVFLEILLLSFNHPSNGFISSKSGGISHVSSKGIAKDIISEKKDGQDRGNILGFERIEPTAAVNTSGQRDVDESHLYLVDDHRDDRDRRDHHDNDRHDRDHDDRWFGDNDRWDDDDDRWDDDDDGWFDDDDDHHDHDRDRDRRDRDRDHDRH